MGPKKGGFYAVGVGRSPGVYTNWDETFAQVNGFPAAKHKKFPTQREAELFVQSHTPSWTPKAGASDARVSSPYWKPPPPSGAVRGAQEPQRRNEPPAYKTARPQSKTLGSRREEGIGSLVGSRMAARRVYCDGSSLGNGKHGASAGIGVWWSHEIGARNLSERLPGVLQTNNRAEMYAVARILESDPTPHLPLTICTDSQYTISVFSEWITKWARNGWKSTTGPVANKDLILYILALLNARLPPGAHKCKPNVSFHKVKAHVGIEGNEQADTFAKAGARMASRPEREYEREARRLEQQKKLQLDELELDFEIASDDLLTDDELRRLSENQNF